MNNKGAVGFMILMAIVYFIAGMIIYQFVKPDITTARADMECSTATDWGDMAVCLMFDAIIPYMVIGILATAGSLVTREVIK